MATPPLNGTARNFRSYLFKKPFARDALTFLILTVATMLFMLPAIASAWMANSDIAIVDIQAAHMLHGEWAAFLWSNVYQGCIFPLIAAAGFAVLGPNEPFLFVMSLIAYIVMQGFLYAILRRRLTRRLALLLCLPTAFVSPIFALNMFYPRFVTLAIAMASLWLADGATSARRPLAWLAGATTLFSFGIYVDEYILFFLPGLGILGLLAAFDPPSTPRQRLTRFIWFAIPLAAGCLVMLYVRAIAHATGTIGDATGAIRQFNAHLLIHECLPYLFAAKWYDQGVPRPVQPSGLVQILLWAAAAAYIGACAYGCVQAARPSTPWRTRRLAACALAIWGFGVVAFLISHVAVDAKSCRYIAPILFTAPF
ncbi:MAG: glycosyltransferase family 39 protein [Capsulimonadaceae bacterium]|nr:glycosyltransferase family 39 protein [Capsulimonadaceae bacterium]